MSSSRHRYWTVGLLLLGIALLGITLARTDTRPVVGLAEQIGLVLPLALLPGAAWHLLRTAAWHQSFPVAERPSYLRAFRLRLVAEAFGYLTISSVAGDPFKVVLLRDEIAPPVAAAAVALERILYVVTTTAIVSAAAAVAVVMVPLSNTWQAIFLSMALVPPLLAVVVALWLHRRRAQPAPGTHAPATTKLRRFLQELMANLEDVFRRDRRRLVRVAAIETAAYGAMALEVWLALRLAHAPISWIGAFAVESFTRVTSMAAAMIPANVGALEASNVAGGSALHVAAGGLALAVVRRVRGLFWCAAGFAVYPGRHANRAAGAGPARMVIDRHTEVGPDDVLGGLPIGERIAREAARDGYRQLRVWSPMRADEWRRAARRVRRLIEIHVEPDVLPDDGAVKSRIAFPIDTRDDLAAAERALRASIFKPTDGHLARFNRRISIPISVALIRLIRMNANAMSILIIGLGVWAGWLFGRGDYVSGVVAALISWAASVLDGCDGELARLQYTASAFGCWVDTFGDYTYYVAVFAGLTVGSVRATGWTGFWWIGAALAGGLLLTFMLLILLRGRITAGDPEQLNARTKAHFYQSGKRWKWLVAKLSNCATRATMPYGIVAFAVAGLLPVVLVLGAIGVQVYWISLAVELRRLLAGSNTIAALTPSKT